MLPTVKYAKQHGVSIFSLARDLPLLPAGFGNAYAPRAAKYAIEQYFDKVLVRVDSKIADVASIVPGLDGVANKLAYVGYTIKPLEIPTIERDCVVAVNTGQKIGTKTFFKKLIEASQYVCTELSVKEWILVCAPDLIDTLQKYADAISPNINFSITAPDPDLAQKLKASKLNIVLGGVTAIESISLGVPTIISPYIKKGLEHDLGRCEQFRRAEALSDAGKLGIYTTGHLKEVSPNDYAKLLTRAFNDGRALLKYQLKIEGEKNAANIIHTHLQNKAKNTIVR